MQIRAARVSDAQGICNLVNHYAERGRMLHRSLESVYARLREFIVADDDGRVIGCAAVAIFWADLAEIKSLAIHPDCRGKGIGSDLVRSAINEARQIGVKRLFALTYEKDFFGKHRFAVIDRGTLPEKVWTECLACPKADACDEIAMILSLEGEKSEPSI